MAYIVINLQEIKEPTYHCLFIRSASYWYVISWFMSFKPLFPYKMLKVISGTLFHPLVDIVETRSCIHRQWFCYQFV